MARLAGLHCVAAALLVALMAAGVAAIDSPCSACMIAAAELQARLDKERPRNHIDLRHRLDERGKRYGKVIEYKLSELRAVEMLDELCEEASRRGALYRFSEDLESGSAGGDDPANLMWLETDQYDKLWDDLGARRVLASETQQRAQLATFCGAIMGKHEDDIVEALQGDDFGTEAGVAPVLCERIAKRCRPGQVADIEEELEALPKKRKEVENAKRELEELLDAAKDKDRDKEKGEDKDEGQEGAGTAAAGAEGGGGGDGSGEAAAAVAEGGEGAGGDSGAAAEGKAKGSGKPKGSKKKKRKAKAAAAEAGAGSGSDEARTEL